MVKRDTLHIRALPAAISPWLNQFVDLDHRETKIEREDDA